LLRRLADGAKGTEHELEVAHCLAQALSHTYPGEAEIQFHNLVDMAINCERFDLASSATSGLATLAVRGGRLQDALALIDQMKDYTRRAGLGPWTQLSDEVQRLQVLALQGRNMEVLLAIHALRETMANLPERSQADERTVHWNVRELVFGIGRDVARDLRRWKDALALNAELLDSLRLRNAPRHQQMRSRFNDVSPLLEIGRLEEAEALLLACKKMVEDEHDIEGLGSVFSALAELKDKLGHWEDAIRLRKEALRLSYVINDPDYIASRHFNLATSLQRMRKDAVAVAHRLVSTMIWLQIGSGQLTNSLDILARDLASFNSNPPLPDSFTELCRLVNQVEAVHFAQLFERLPKRAPDGEAALAEVLRLVRELS
jgi:tetratricopeptide (TPR) repeat protein